MEADDRDLFSFVFEAGLFFLRFLIFRSHNEIGLKIDTNKEREREIKWYPKKTFVI